MDAKIANCLTTRSCSSELSSRYFGDAGWKLYNDSHERLVQSQSCHRANNAFAPHRCRLDGFSIFQNSEQRKHPVVWEVDVFKFIPRFDQYQPLRQWLGYKVRRKQIEPVARRSEEHT